MARPSKSDTQDTWESHINRAIKVREEWSDKFHVEQARSFFEGDQNPGWPENEWITINKIYTRLLATLPALMGQDPYFHVTVRRSYSPDPVAIAEFEAKGKVRESKLNYCWREVKGTDAARLGVQDAQFAFGALKIHYHANMAENPDAGEAIYGSNQDEPLRDEDGNVLIEPDMLPSDEKYHVSRIHPDDILWGVDSGPLENRWTWIAERQRMSYSAAKADPRFVNANIPKSGGDQEKDKRPKDPTTGKALTEREQEVTIWEIWDLKNRQWMVIAEDAKKPLMDWEPYPPGVEEHPYSILRFVLRDKSPYPIPPVSQAIGPQKELNETRSRMLRHRKRFNRKYEVNVNNLVDQDDDLFALEAGEDGTVIRTMGHAVEPIKDAPLDQQTTFGELGSLNADIIEVLGPQGPDLAQADSATAAALIDKAENLKEADRRKMVVEWVATAARKLDQLIQVHLTTEEAVRVMGPSGASWQAVSPASYMEIAGEYEYGVTVGSATPRIPQIERAQLLALLNMLAQFPHLMTSERMMKRLFEMHEMDDDSLLAELMQIGQQIISGQVAPPGGSSTGEPNPISALLGTALGPQGGIAGGGGSPELAGAL